MVLKNGKTIDLLVLSQVQGMQKKESRANLLWDDKDVIKFIGFH